ncbi:MAG: zinc ribbon domain-containing protein [Veillonella parvula]
MPLNEDSLISREDDGSYNGEDYCKWCYTNGEFVYKTKEHLLDFSY